MIPKPKKKNGKLDYRPLSICECILMIFHKLIKAELTKRFYKYISKSQYCFRKSGVIHAKYKL